MTRSSTSRFFQLALISGAMLAGTLLMTSVASAQRCGYGGNYYGYGGSGLSISVGSGFNSFGYGSYYRPGVSLNYYRPSSVYWNPGYGYYGGNHHFYRNSYRGGSGYHNHRYRGGHRGHRGR